jgi:replicative DNA helicase
LIFDNNNIDTVAAIVKSSDFYFKANETVYRSIMKMYEQKHPIDLTTLTEDMHCGNELENIGGPAYLAELMTLFISPDSLEYTARKIREYSLRRKLLNTAHFLTDKCGDKTEETMDILNYAEHEIMAISSRLYTKGPIPLHEQIPGTMSLVEGIYKKQLKTLGVPSGYHRLDEVTSGFQGGDLVIIAGRPSHGKTSLALCIARNAAMESKLPMAIFSIEMSNRELSIRFLATEAKVDIQNLKNGHLSEKEWQSIADNAGKLYPANCAEIIIDDTSSMSLIEIRSKARKLKTEKNIAMLIIDYLQLMDTEGIDAGNRNLDLGVITRGLKILAKELNIPVVVLSQLSRKIEERAAESRRPQLSDLRESGSIEQDADVVIFVNRPEVYISKDSVKFEEVKGRADIYIAKQRNGPTDEIRLTFIKEYAKFENFTTKKHQEPEYRKESATETQRTEEKKVTAKNEEIF